MKPIKFKEVNDSASKTDPTLHHTYKTFPCWKGTCTRYGYPLISCWRLNLWERIKVLFLGHVWLHDYARPQPPPAFITCKRPNFLGNKLAWKYGRDTFLGKPVITEIDGGIQVSCDVEKKQYEKNFPTRDGGTTNE